jgi:ankyrin repeat protein
MDSLAKPDPNNMLFGGIPKHTRPNWSNLVYLNISSTSALHIQKALVERMFEGAPNIEELYLHRNIWISDEGWKTVFTPLRKLKYLTIQEDTILSQGRFYFAGSSSDADYKLIVDQVPHLQILVSFRTLNVVVEPKPADVQNIGNTIKMPSSALMSRDLETVKKFGSLLKRSNYASYFMQPYKSSNTTAGIRDERFSFELLNYLFNELKLDINGASERNNPFVAYLFSISLFKTTQLPISPLTSVVDNADEVQKMLYFGADPDMLYDNVTPFAAPLITKDTCILLLERGADPLKKRNGKAAVAHLFRSEKMTPEDIAEVMQVILKNGIDANSVVEDNTTLLDIATQFRYQETMRILAQHGAQWTAKAMDYLITWDRQWWAELILRKAFDAKKLLLSTTLLAIKVNMFDLVSEYITKYPKEIDANGYGLVHYLAMLPLLPTRQFDEHKMIPHRKGGSDSTEPKKRTSVVPLDVNATNIFGANSSVMPVTSPASTARSWSAPRKTPSSVGTSTDVTMQTSTLVPLELIINGAKLDVNLRSAKGETPLLLVCENPADEVEIVKVIVNAGADVNEPDENGWSPLHAALYLMNLATAQFLLSRGANPNAQDKFGLTPVMALTLSTNFKKEEYLDTWEQLLASGYDVTITDKHMSRSILHFLSCADRGHILLKSLLEARPGLNVNCRDAHGFTPLHYAAMRKQTDAIELLLSHGADTNAVSDTLKLTPFMTMIASMDSRSACHNYIQSYNTLREPPPVTITYIGTNDAESMEIFKVTKPFWMSAKNGISGLTSGVKRSPFDYIALLSSYLSVKDLFGNTCLHYIMHNYQRFSLWVLSPLPDEIHSLWSVPNIFGTTPFHLYAQNHLPAEKTSSFSGSDSTSTSNLEHLLTQHSHQILYSLNNRDRDGKTALEYLLQHPRVPKHIRSLLYQIPGVKFASPIVIEKQSSLIHGAIQNGTLNKEILAKIAENDPEALNHKVDGQTPLMAFVEMILMSAAVKQFDLLDSFLGLKFVDLNAQDNHGDTALHYACYWFHQGGLAHKQLHRSHAFSLVLFKLLDAGARVDIKNNSGQSPLDLIPNLMELDRSAIRLTKSETNTDEAMDITVD